MVISDSEEETKVERKPVMKPEGKSNKLANKVQRKRAVEVMCGCARLTKEFNTAGFEAVGIDCKNNKDTPLAKCKWIDLSTTRGQQEAENMLFDKKSGFDSFAPPCGTSSMSTEI